FSQFCVKRLGYQSSLASQYRNSSSVSGRAIVTMCCDPVLSGFVRLFSWYRSGRVPSVRNLRTLAHSCCRLSVFRSAPPPNPLPGTQGGGDDNIGTGAGITAFLLPPVGISGFP